MTFEGASSYEWISGSLFGAAHDKEVDNTGSLFPDHSSLTFHHGSAWASACRRSDHAPFPYKRRYIHQMACRRPRYSTPGKEATPPQARPLFGAFRSLLRPLWEARQAEAVDEKGVAGRAHPHPPGLPRASPTTPVPAITPRSESSRKSVRKMSAAVGARRAYARPPGAPVAPEAVKSQAGRGYASLKHTR